MLDLQETVSLENMFGYEPGLNKDKLISLRLDKQLYNFLEEMTAIRETGSISETVRNLLSMYVLLKSVEVVNDDRKEQFSRYLEQVRTSGNEIELKKYREYSKEVTDYLSYLVSFEENATEAVRFMKTEVEKVRKFLSFLQDAEITMSVEDD